MTVCYANTQRKIVRLIIRAYNDGVAFRYAFANDDPMKVKKERTTLIIPELSNTWAMKYLNNSEEYYLKRKSSEMTDPIYHLPALVETPAKQWLLVNEADVLGRSAAIALSGYKGNCRFALTTEYPLPERNQWFDQNS